MSRGALVVGIVYFVLVMLVIFLFGGCGMPPTKPVAREQLEIVSSAKSLPPVEVLVITPCLDAKDVPPPPPTWMAGASDRKLPLASVTDLKEMDEWVKIANGLLLRCIRVFAAEVVPK